MTVDPPHLSGLGLIAVIMAIIGWLLLRRQPRAIQLFACALCLVGLGYLATTPAPTELIRALFGSQH